MSTIFRSDYEIRGKRLMVEYTCGRCGRTHLEPASNQASAALETLANYKPPKGWSEQSINVPMLCDKCAIELERFLNTSVEEETKDYSIPQKKRVQEAIQYCIDKLERESAYYCNSPKGGDHNERL